METSLVLVLVGSLVSLICGSPGDQADNYSLMPTDDPGGVGAPVKKLPEFSELSARAGVGATKTSKVDADPFSSADLLCPGPVQTHGRHCEQMSSMDEKFRRRFAADAQPHPTNLARDYILHSGMGIRDSIGIRAQKSRMKRSAEEYPTRRKNEEEDWLIQPKKKHQLCFGEFCEKLSPATISQPTVTTKTGEDPRTRYVLLLGSLSNETLDLFKSCADYHEYNVSTAEEIEEILGRPYDETKYHVINVPMLKSSNTTADLVAAKMKVIMDNMYRNFAGFSYVSVQPGGHDRRHKGKPRKGSSLWSEIMDYCQTNYFLACNVVDSISDTLAAVVSDNHFTIQLEMYSAKKHTYVPPLFTPVVNLSDETLIRRQLKLLADEYCKVAGHTFAVINGTMKPEYRSLGRIVTFNADTKLTLADIFPTDKESYDKSQPPKQRGRPTVVNFHVTVLSMDSINEESMTYVTDIFLAQSWRDHRLRLPEDMHRDYRILDVQWLHNIWRPDVFFKNAKQVTFHEISIPNHYLWLFSDKTLLYMSRLTLVLSCAMEFQSFPHDTQICSMMLESLSHTTQDLVFKWNFTDPLVVNPSIELPQLDIARNSTEDCTLQYSTGNFTCIAVVFNLKRRIGYHLLHTYVPSALIVVMSWISFWIKPEAIPGRVTLGVTSLLTLATQNTQSQQSLPPVSYVKAVDIWMNSCAIFVFASLMEFAIVNHFMDSVPHGPAHVSAIPPADEEELAALTRKYSLPDSTVFLSDINQVTGVLSMRPQYITTFTGKEIAVLVDKISRVIFPIAFITLNVIYWTTFIA